MHIEVHFIAQGKFFHEFAQLRQRVEKWDASAPIKIIWFNEPDIASFVHFFADSKFSGYLIFVFLLNLLYLLILFNFLIYDFQLRRVIWFLFARKRFHFDFLKNVKVLTKSIDFIDEVFGR